MDVFPSLAGQVLIAMPSIGDARFERTVIYLCVHDADGAMGLIVNRPDPERTVAKVLDELGMAADDEEGAERLSSRVLVGGPVEKTRGFVLHTTDDAEREGTVAVSDNIYLTTTLDVLRDLSAGRGPEHFLLALGFANWDAGQLDQEILQNAWLPSPVDSEGLFETPPELHYAASLTRLGVDLHQLSPVAGRG